MCRTLARALLRIRPAQPPPPRLLRDHDTCEVVAASRLAAPLLLDAPFWAALSLVTRPTTRTTARAAHAGWAAAPHDRLPPTNPMTATRRTWRPSAAHRRRCSRAKHEMYRRRRRSAAPPPGLDEAASWNDSLSQPPQHIFAASVAARPHPIFSVLQVSACCFASVYICLGPASFVNMLASTRPALWTKGPPNSIRVRLCSLALGFFVHLTTTLECSRCSLSIDLLQHLCCGKTRENPTPLCTVTFFLGNCDRCKVHARRAHLRVRQMQASPRLTAPSTRLFTKKSKGRSSSTRPAPERVL